MQVTRSNYYNWLKRPAKLITADELNLYRRAKTLFQYHSTKRSYYLQGLSDGKIATWGDVFEKLKPSSTLCKEGENDIKNRLLQVKIYALYIKPNGKLCYIQ